MLNGFNDILVLIFILVLSNLGSRKFGNHPQGAGSPPTSGRSSLWRLRGRRFFVGRRIGVFALNNLQEPETKTSFRSRFFDVTLSLYQLTFISAPLGGISSVCTLSTLFAMFIKSFFALQRSMSPNCLRYFCTVLLQVLPILDFITDYQYSTGFTL